MRKLWSYSTTVRNPERIRDFLRILKEIEGVEWTRPNQKKFQVLLIKNRLYGYGNTQFYNSLPKKYVDLIDSDKKISFDMAEKILDSKNYTGGGDMRGRQSFNPIEKMGLAYLTKDNKIKISSFGEYFLKEDYDLGEVFFRSFIKWQLPNFDSTDFKEEDSYDIKPFIATLHLINEVNKLYRDSKNKEVGISRIEFSIFVPTLVNHKQIKDVAKKIIEFRKLKEKSKDSKKFVKEYHYNYFKEFLATNNEKEIIKTISNSKEYTDNLIRYFRLTRYIYIRGNGYYIDLEPRRRIEIKSLLSSDNASIKEFKSKDDFYDYLGDLNEPILPWQNKPTLLIIVKDLLKEIKDLELLTKIKDFNYLNYEKFDIRKLNEYIDRLREYRRRLQDEINHKESQGLNELKNYIIALKEIYSAPNRALMLEKYVSLGLNALNDAIRIKPNYLVGDDNEPTNTAIGGKPDIECFYEEFNSICEVTLLKGRDQWYNEGQPVMRHLRDFELEINEKKKPTYCIFVAPLIHRDTINTFWMATKYEYEGLKQKIIPLSIGQFISLLELLLMLKEKDKFLKHTYLRNLYESLSNLKDIKDSSEWLEVIPKKIDEWKKEVLIC